MRGFGIVGCGMVSEFHARAIEALPNAQLRAVCSRSEANAKRRGEQFNADWTTDLDRLLNRSDIDIVSVCSASGAHAEPTVAAAKAGKHVIVEKPLDITLERIDAMIEACAEAGVQLSGVFQSRFHPTSQLLKKAVESGRFGRLTLAEATVKWWRSQEYYDEGGWKGTKALDGGGALMNQSIHAIDLLQWLMGPAAEIAAFKDTLAHERIDVEDTAAACIRFQNGALGVIQGATSVHPGFFKKIEISGDRGSVVMEEENIAFWQFADETDEDERIRAEFADQTQTGGGASDPSAISFEGHRRQFEAFIDQIETGRSSGLDGTEARKAVEIIHAIYRSAETRSFVPLPL